MMKKHRVISTTTINDDIKSEWTSRKSMVICLTLIASEDGA
jgi:hypothetical protein